MWRGSGLGTLLLICLATASVASLNVVQKEVDYDNNRLPRSVRPKSYRLVVITHLEDPNNLHFKGDVAIRIQALQETSNITLHAQNLTIDDMKIRLKPLGMGMDENCIMSSKLDTRHDYLILNLCKPLKQGAEYEIFIPFNAELNQRLRGYYRSSYFDRQSNETRWLAVTQFEPAAARAAFPCFDEPEYKANFTVVLGHENKYIALSNMPMKNTMPMEGMKNWIWSEFEESVAMSTYLVAYTVNDFAYSKSETNLRHKVQFRTWARRDAIDQCNYAGEVGPKVLQYYEHIFDIKFPLDKIDQIAIPDFSAGAMENWGLVTYRETALLYADNVSSLANKQRVASVIAHELAHQWFGNLVTMKWWTDLWLNEGFATYIASLGVEHISPEWNSLQEESVDNLLTIFKLDALKSSHPISQPIQHTAQISEIFDSISYKKGSAVLRMMHQFLGDQAFREGVKNYLKKHAYNNAEQDDLWSALTQAAYQYRAIPESFDIKRIMDSWTLQTGYPLITVERDYAKKTAQVSQVRYLLDAAASRRENMNCWWVPLSYTSQNESDFDMLAPKQWLQCNEKNDAVPMTVVDMPADNEWVIFNVQLAGLFKVKYDEKNWDLLINTLVSDKYQSIHTINRAQLIDDALTLAWSGDQDYDVALRLIDYLKREREYIPWKTALENLSNVNRILRQTPEYEFFKVYMREILNPIYNHLQGLNVTNIDNADSNVVLHKVLVAGWACRFDIEDCVRSAQTYFKNWRTVSNPDEQNPVPTDLRSVVYCTAIRSGNDQDWQFLWTRYKNSNVAAEKRTILSALGCSREVWLLQRYLEWAFDGTKAIRKQDSFYAFGAVAHGEIGFHLAREYFVSNIQFLHNFYEPDTADLGRLISPLAAQISNKPEFENMKMFLEGHMPLLTKSKQGVLRALETMQVNVMWKDRNYKAVSERLRKKTDAMRSL